MTDLNQRPIYKGLEGWRDHQTAGYVAQDMTERVGGPFQQVPLQAAASADEAECCGDKLLLDSILMLPSLVSPAECATLIAAAEHHCAADEWSDVTRHRIPCHPDGANLDEASHKLSHIILSRALWAVESLRPELAGALFPDACDLGDFWFHFSGDEPTINRYTSGGNFEPHQDGGCDLTVFVPLSTSEVDFCGGGTAFWSASLIGPDPNCANDFPPSLVMKPPAGTGLFWRGNITHAGLPVASGIRHVFVAGFTLLVPGAKGSRLRRSA